MQLGKIRKINPRDIWPKKSKDFTPWLADSIGALGEALGMELELKEQKLLLAISP